MGQLGFYCFTAPPPVVVPTLKERVRALTDEQRMILLRGFEQRLPAGQLPDILHIPAPVIQDVYDGIDAMQIMSKQCMRGEYLITPAVTHIDPETGEIVIDSPAVYNEVPTTIGELRALLQPVFTEDFPNNFIALVTSEMVTWCKFDGTGNWNYYASHIIL